MASQEESRLTDWFVEISRYTSGQPTCGFIPPGTNLFDQDEVAGLIRTAFGEDDYAIQQCLDFVEENFRDTITNLMPVNPLSPIIYSQRLSIIADRLAAHLRGNIDYWPKFSVKAAGEPFWTIPLCCLTELWNRNRNSIRYYGLARYTNNTARGRSGFIYRNRANDWRGDPRHSPLVNFKQMDDLDSRIFITGLVVDLIRMGKMLVDDYFFVEQLSELI